MAGASWPEIARALGYSDGAQARKAVASNVTEWKLENAAELIRMELERLDMLQLVVWRQARQGDLKSIETVLKIMSQRAKYLGLDDGNKAEDDGDATKGVIVIGGDSEEYIEAIKRVTERTKKRSDPIEGRGPGGVVIIGNRHVLGFCVATVLAVIVLRR
jgi:hypothetical protein